MMEATAVKAENVIKFSLLPPEIQLLTWVKNKNIGAIVRLYSHGAPGDAVDKNGDNLLHIAVKTGDLQVIQAVLMLYGRNHLLYSRTNNEGKRPSDLTFSVEILKCIEIIETGVLSIKNKKSNSDSLSGSGRGDVKCDIDNQINRDNIEKILKQKNERLAVFLSLDGGGIRGLVLIRILMYLEWKLGSSLWQKIDWAAGTSTGGIITLGLAKKHSLEDVLKLYLRLKNEIFVGRRPYSAKDFERLLKQELGNDTMSSVVSPKLVITSCLTHVAPPKLKLFRNYVPAAGKIRDNERKKLGYDDPNHVLLWKAARCSSAAPTYFPPFEEIYSDGGIIANNPTVELLTEFFRYKNIAAYKNDPISEDLGCVVSIGTGIAPVIKIAVNQTRISHFLKAIYSYGEYLKNMVLVLIKQITASDGSPVDQSRAWCMSLNVPFFRFSPHLRAAVDLDEHDDKILVEMMWDAEFYMATRCTETVRDLVSFLKQSKPITS